MDRFEQLHSGPPRDILLLLMILLPVGVHLAAVLGQTEKRVQREHESSISSYRTKYDSYKERHIFFLNVGLLPCFLPSRTVQTPQLSPTQASIRERKYTQTKYNKSTKVEEVEEGRGTPSPPGLDYSTA